MASSKILPEVGRFYLCYIPNVLNNSSPVSSPPALVLEVPQETNKKLEFRVCLVVNYIPSSNIATMLLSTSNPEQPHHFVPFKGTPRKDYQPKKELAPQPPDQELPGHLNFTHLFRIKVLTLDDAGKDVIVIIPNTKPGAIALAHITRKVDASTIKITLPSTEFQYPKTLHSKYKAGIRYTASGNEIMSDAGFGNLPDDTDGSADDKNSGSNGNGGSGGMHDDGAEMREIDGSNMSGGEWAALVRDAIEELRMEQKQFLDGSDDDQNISEEDGTKEDVMERDLIKEEDVDVDEDVCIE